MKITHKKKLEWMAIWCANNKAALNLKGECGFGRKCVGIVANGSYPDYEWHDRNTYGRLDNNGEVWCPADAYHKHPCVAVLGRGKDAESQLYDWLKWFDDSGFKLKTGEQDYDRSLGEIAILLNKHRFARMVKQATPA